MSKYCWISGVLCLLTLMLSGQSNPVGWASVGSGTSGGQGGESIVVESRNSFVSLVGSPEPLIIRIRDTIDLVLYERIAVGDNTTIIGITENAMLRYGGLEIKGNNVIVKNLIIGDSFDGGVLRYFQQVRRA